MDLERFSRTWGLPFAAALLRTPRHRATTTAETHAAHTPTRTISRRARDTHVGRRAYLSTTAS